MSTGSYTALSISSGRVYKASSSLRYKKNITDLTMNRNVLNLRPVSYEYKESGQHDVGLIAEEVEKLVPELVVYEFKPQLDAQGKPVLDKDGNVVYTNEKQVESVKYDRISIYLLEIIKDHDKQINEMKSIIDQQQKQIEQLLKK
jgi:hypothetical protein